MWYTIVSFTQDSDFSRDFCDKDLDPFPGPAETHGTSVAGEIASVKSNANCGTGVAYSAVFGSKCILQVYACILLCVSNFTLVGIRLIACPISDIDIANALTYRNDIVHIYSNSWGPKDDGGTIAGPRQTLQMVLQNAMEQVILYIGRCGKVSTPLTITG